MTILIVDDLDTDFEITKRILIRALNALGIFAEVNLQRAKNENDAIKKIHEVHLDLIIEDGNLEKGQSGINVLDKIDPEFFNKTIGLSDDEKFLDYCRDNNIMCFNKNDLLDEGKVIYFLGMIKKILKPGS